MRRIPARPDIGQLKKQAKELLALYRSNDPEAARRFRESLPAAAGRTEAGLAALGLRLHDAQSCVAREYGFASWAELQGVVLARRVLADDPARAVFHWLRHVYAGDVAGGMGRARPGIAARLLEDHPDLMGSDPYLACAVGDEAALRRASTQEPAWIHRTGGPLRLPPLVAVTHSSLRTLPSFRERMFACARFLLEAGASPNQSVGNRWPPASLDSPSGSEQLSALYGAAGQHPDPEFTRLLLDAGADPNDGESLYHSLANPACTRLLLDVGARVTGSNALYRVLDLDDVETLRMLLEHGGDANEPPQGAPTSDWGSPLLWAIRRRRSLSHVEALLAAGADPEASTPDGTPARLWALRFGLTAVARRLQEASEDGVRESAEEAFIAACARGDEAGARDIQARHPDLIASLTGTQLRLLPELASEGCCDAVKVMVSLGWPIEVRAGDWDASALNHAVFRGDAVLTRFLLERGADWRALHGFGDDAIGTLSWASLNEPVDGGDWPGCAQELAKHGMPPVRPDPQDADGVLVGGQRRCFSDDVTDVLLGKSLTRT